MAGELYIGGAGLARGYLHRPDLTADRFVPHPFAASPGERLYRTGNRVRWRADGQLEFLGRLDHQLKLRGQRIEPGEIEAVLGQHPEVKAAVVVLDAGRPGEAPPPAARLVAYVVSAGENRPGPAELRRFLAGRLPEYMVPSSFVALERLPLLPNGKLDRAALPAPVASASSAWTAPRTATEARLAEIWSEVLGRAGIGVHDNFFELGGDSILSIQIVSRARQAGLQLAVRDLFEHQSIAELSAVATSAVAQEAPQGPVSGPVPLTPIQHWFLEQCAPDFHHFNQAIVLRMAHPPDLGRLHLALGHLLDHHDALRLRLRRTPESWEQHNACWDGAVPLTGADLSELDEEAQRRAAAGLVAEAHASLNLADGPLVRAVAVNLGPRRGARLVVIAHHLAVDGVSWRILLEDLAQAYRQLAAGEAVVLPPKTTSFQQWARRLRDYAQSPAVQDQREHWLGLHDHGLPPLPLDRTQGTNTTATARTLTAWLSPAETRALLNEVPAAYHTEINDVLLCALALAFQAWTGQRALLVDLEGHGREDIAPDLDLSRTVGWFTTLYPVRLELPGVPGPGPALTAVKEQLRHVPQRGLGYGLLRHLHPDAALATRLQALPPRPISFNYLGQYDQLLAADAPFAWAHESAGPAHSPRGTRSHLLSPQRPHHRRAPTPGPDLQRSAPPPGHRQFAPAGLHDRPAHPNHPLPDPQRRRPHPLRLPAHRLPAA